jgi:hypothetical protein
LYDEYRLTEPWDSEHNKTLLGKMPAVFRSATEPSRTVCSAYYVLVGDNTLFSSRNDGVAFQEVTDGLSKTLMIVEAKRDIPWTKPEDIPYEPGEPLPPIEQPYEPAKPLPSLGGFFEDRFLAALADGSVQVFGTDIDPRLLRIMIEKSDGQPMPAPE